jgi:hypothetical protein
MSLSEDKLLLLSTAPPFHIHLRPKLYPNTDCDEMYLEDSPAPIIMSELVAPEFIFKRFLEDLSPVPFEVC